MGHQEWSFRSPLHISKLYYVRLFQSLDELGVCHQCSLERPVQGACQVTTAALNHFQKLTFIDLPASNHV